MNYLVTGSAGFIGFHTARRLLADGHAVVGFDALTPYYDPELKRRRHGVLEAEEAFTAIVGELEDRASLADAFARAAPDVVVHLAAQAGVRYSVDNPAAYLKANLEGSFNVMELAVEAGVRHLVLGSTSSVYGANTDLPYPETANSDRPLSFYAATKKGMEAMAHALAGLHGLPTTACRFFTVYGPWGRPDMALFKFSEAILSGRPIQVYGEGNMKRDLTYVGDLAEALVGLADIPPNESNRVDAPGVTDTLSPAAPFRVVNIGTGRPVALGELIAEIERALGREAIRELVPMQPGDMRETHASPRLLEALTGLKLATPLSEGVDAFAAWYREHYSPAPTAA